MGLLNRGEVWLDGVLDEVTVTLRRGDQVTTGVKAEVGRTPVMSETDVGTVSYESRDYVIAVAAYAFGGQAVKPADEDVIEEEVGGETLRQQVLPLGDEPAARHAGPLRRKWRVHTKRIGEAD